MERWRCDWSIGRRGAVDHGCGGAAAAGAVRTVRTLEWAWWRHRRLDRALVAGPPRHGVPPGGRRREAQLAAQQGGEVPDHADGLPRRRAAGDAALPSVHEGACPLLLPCLIWIQYMTVSCYNTNQRIAPRGLDFTAISRKEPRLESPSGCVLGPESPSNPGVIGPEKHHVAFEFAGGRSAEFAGGRRTSVEPSNIANGGYTRENPSKPGILGPEKHHVTFEFVVEPSNIGNGGYTRGLCLRRQIELRWRPRRFCSRTYQQ